MKKSVAAVFLAIAILLGFAGPAAASRADGVCGGVGSYNIITGECE